MINDLQQLIQADQQRMAILRKVAALQLPDCWVAAGFVRNLVWDHLHGYDATPLNDVDVIYYDIKHKDIEHSHQVQTQLCRQSPEINWEVKNQAIMYQRNGHAPYTDTADAMSYWPEKETAVGVRLGDEGGIDIIAPWGIESLFAGHITYNPKRERSLFNARIAGKKWLQRWSKLKVR